MTDKQIIIDVSDCSELCGTKCHILMSCTNSSKSDSCSEMPNCYYKQLKAKEQECEELNADNISLRDRVGKLERAILRRNEQLDQLKAENDELKYKAEFFENYNNAHINKITKLEKTLTEIKEIAEKQIPYHDFEKLKTFIELEYNYAGKVYDLEQRMHKILQKISECEGNDEN